MSSTEVHYDKKRLKIQNPLRLYRFSEDLSDTYYYECKDLHSVGITINVLLKHIKKIDNKNIKAYYIFNPEKLVFTGEESYKHQKYHSFYKAGSWTKGPYIQRSPKGLFKYLLRRHLLYKTRDKALYKKICVFSNLRSDLAKERSSKEIVIDTIKQKLFCKVVPISKLFNRI